MFGRMLFVGLRLNDKNIIKRLILECHVGGIILYARNYQNYQEMVKLVNYIHELANEAGYIVFVGIDQEGGRVNRLPKDFKNLKSPYAFCHSVLDIKNHALILATILAETNIKINFAPVLDIKRFDENHAIGDRCFGEDANTVIKNTIPYIKEFEKRQVIPVVKHFPGHGATKANSHYFFPVIWNTKKILEEDILPFKEAIDNHIDVIMVGHFIIPKFSYFFPTSLSRHTTQYLRNDLKYSNLIMTDDLFMGVFKFLPKRFLMRKAINSGMNMIMIKYYDNFFKDFRYLERNQKKLKEENIQHSIKLIEQLIKKYHVTNKRIENHLDIAKINKEIERLNEHAKKSLKK